MDNFLNKTINGYKILSYINKGKSGAVYRAVDDKGNPVAFKLFFEEIVNKFGHEIQEERILQELSLKDHTIQGLVKILEGGTYIEDSQTFHFVVMELIEGKNLKVYIDTENYDEDFIKKVLSTILEVSEKLIEKGLAHRDIKPENIMITLNSEVILMDLGVLKPIGHFRTDNESIEKQFLATLRYAPPELLFREEEDNISGWRAINYYQIGGVLHDLLMKKELFSGVSPYTNLVKAIEHDVPEITSGNYSTRLVSLTKCLLVKDQSTRLRLANADNIKSYLQYSDSTDEFEEELNKSKAINSSHQLEIEEIKRHQKTREELVNKRRELLQQVKGRIMLAVDVLKEKEVISAYNIGTEFKFESDIEKNTQGSLSITNIPFRITKDLSHGFPNAFYFSIGIAVNNESITEIKAVAFFGNSTLKENMSDFQSMILQALNPNKKIGTQIFGAAITPVFKRSENLVTKVDSINLFEGVFSNDELFQKDITIKVLKLLNKAKEIGKTETEIELKQQKEMVLGNRSGYVSYGRKITFINSI